MIYPNDFGDPQTFPSSATSWLRSHPLLDELAQNIHGSQTMYPPDFGDPLTFLFE